MKAETVQLIPVGQPVGPLKWQMSMNGGPPKAQGQYPALHAPNRDPLDITFTIQHPGAIDFADTNAFCAQEGTSKPQTCDTSVFTYSINQKGDLVVHDSNPKDATYTYVINFNRAPQLDPIIKNGGIPPGGTRSSLETTVAVVAAVLVLAAIALFAWRKLMPSAPK